MTRNIRAKIKISGRIQLVDIIHVSLNTPAAIVCQRLFWGFNPESEALPVGEGCIQGGSKASIVHTLESKDLIWRSRGNRDF